MSLDNLQTEVFRPILPANPGSEHSCHPRMSSSSHWRLMIIDHPGNIGERDPPVVSHGQVDHHQEHEGAQEEDDVGPEEHHQHRQEVADLGIKQGDADIVSMFQKF